MARYDGARLPRSMPGREDNGIPQQPNPALLRSVVAILFLVGGAVLCAFGVHSMWGSGATMAFLGTMGIVVGVLIARD